MQLTLEGKASRKHIAKPAEAMSATRTKSHSLEKFYGGAIKTDHFHEMILGIYRTEPAARIKLIKAGVSPKVFIVLAKSMGRSKEDLGRALGLSAATIDRKAKLGEKLSADQGERVVGMARLIGQVLAMVEESGDPTDFDAAQWIAGWLDTPVPALGGHHPAEYMDTAEGRGLVSWTLAMMQSGSYA
ncbi:antitoxin Xre-like helix-turn-helix domain-containing protein [Paraburkholderia sp. GAS82]|uniref:antitoxin Xre-like helix-turn-helix domain-containing protein n=1 Tax=Paraburkholderia sp. GAS82 TaxID=3035137 RepID=UPI003D1ED673